MFFSKTPLSMVCGQKKAENALMEMETPAIALFVTGNAILATTW